MSTDIELLRNRRGAWEIVRASGPVLMGLAAVAFTQPLLDLYGRNGESLAALRLSSQEVLAWVAIIGFGPTCVLLGLEIATNAVWARAWRWVHAAAVFLLSASFVLVLLRNMGVDSVPTGLMVSLTGGGLITLGIIRLRPLRMIAAYLAWANLAFIALFFLADGGHLLWSSEAAAIDLPAGDYPPVVVVVFDEFPVSLIVDEDGEINEDRFPNFAALAEQATWFRNATSVSQFTTWAVPAILTGRIPQDDQLPVAAAHPRSLYTLLGDEYSVQDYSVAVDLCPASVCPDQQSAGLSTALKDASVVWGHLSLPGAIRDELPRIDQRLGGFTAGDETDVADEADGDGGRGQVWESIPLDERDPGGQAAVFSDLVDGIEPSAHLTVAHVAIPHWPWKVTPFGFEVSTSHDHELYYVVEDVAGRDFVINQKYQRHVLQAGAVDVLVGELRGSLEARGIWDDALVVITSDHGNSHLGPDFGRVEEANAGNVEELMRVPLFVKPPGQADGGIRDENARTIDILPTIVDLLDLDVDWEFDGHSLYDGSEFPSENPVVQSAVETVSTDVDELLELAGRHAEWYGDDPSWEGLAAVGPLGRFVGADIADLEVTSRHDELAWELDQEAEISDLERASGRLPLVVTGMLRSSSETDVPDYGLVSLNGEVAGVAGGFVRIEPDGYLFSALLTDRFIDGPNDVELLVPSTPDADVPAFKVVPRSPG